jgi:hypothetical protein
MSEAATTTPFDVAIIGAGYVGLPLAQVFADAGKTVVLVDVPGTTRESVLIARCSSQRERAEGRRRLPPRLLARARRPGPHRLHDQDDAQGRRRPDAGLHRARGELYGSGADRHDRAGLVARGGRADEAAREHLPLGQHRARQRAGDALRPHGHRHLGGRRRGRDQAVRLHALQPGPGLGGHCIPIDPFYLSWKAREFDFWTEFIELAGKVNENMPYFCRSQVSRRSTTAPQVAGQGSRVLVLGVAYKPDIGDMRESPALKLIHLLRARRGRRLPRPARAGARAVRRALPDTRGHRVVRRPAAPTRAVDAVVIATPVPTHYALAKQALEAGKHVFVEKPPAMRAAEMEELVALAEERNLVLMPGHLLLYHPGVRS